MKDSRIAVVICSLWILDKSSKHCKVILCKTKMSEFWYLLLGVFFCLFHRGTPITIRDSQVDLSTPNCKALVCEQAHEQAKGLSKLALLDEFVSQTVFLLNDLMQNIDGELEKSASSLLRYIHPHCEPTREILQEVIEKQKEKVVMGSRSLSSGVAPLSDEDSPQEISQTSGDDDNEDGNLSQKSWESEWQGKDDESQVIKPSPIDRSNDKVGGSYKPKETTGRHTFGQGSTSGQRPREWIEKDSTQSWKGNDKRFHGSTEQDKDSHGSGGTFDGSGKTGSRTRNYGKDLREENSGKKICKGVDKGSAFWVPGLDQWCQNNCSKGYCPETHCIC